MDGGTTVTHVDKDLWLCGEDPRKPKEIRPPVCLRGTLPPPPRIGIVGSRETSTQAIRFTRELACRLAQKGCVVVSGGAQGVDAAAHLGAFDGGGKSLAALPSGFDEPFPAEHHDLFRSIVAEGGALVSMHAPSAKVARSNFRMRNRLLVAYCDALVVTAAKFRSGARNAVAWAVRMKRPVYAVVGPPWDESFSGTNLEVELSRARPVFRIESLIRALAIPEGPPTSERHAASRLKAILVEEGPKRMDELLDRGQWSRHELFQTVVSLLLTREIEEREPGEYSVRV